MSNSSSDSETNFKNINRLVDGSSRNAGKKVAVDVNNRKQDKKEKEMPPEEEEEEEEGEEEEDGEYDLMEYGDEFNDEEERQYAKEMYG